MHVPGELTISRVYCTAGRRADWCEWMLVSHSNLPSFVDIYLTHRVAYGTCRLLTIDALGETETAYLRQGSSPRAKYNCPYPILVKIPLKFPDPHRVPDHHQNLSFVATVTRLTPPKKFTKIRGQLRELSR